MEEIEVPPRRRGRGRCRRRRRAGRLLFALCFALAGLAVLYCAGERGLGTAPEHRWTESGEEGGFRDSAAAFAADHDLTLSDWPEELLELGERNPETADFVLHYPLEKDRHAQVDLSDLKDSLTVPLLMQWDQRWGYTEYAGGLMGLTGCGPTCLSMACIYLLKDPGLDPGTVARFAQRNGYSVRGNGSAWSLISQGGEELGLTVTELPLDEGRITRTLEAGKPIIAVMGPGDFTTTGHFIVFTSAEEGGLRVNDPNSRTRSERLWAYEDIRDQIRNLWSLE